MTIIESFVRTEANGSEVCDYLRTKSVSDALHTLLFCEMDFGCSITDVSSEHVTVRTRCLGMIDYTTFSGHGKVINPLIQAAHIYAVVTSSKKIDEELNEKLASVTDGNPRLITMAGEFFKYNGIAEIVSKSLISTMLVQEQTGNDAAISDIAEKPIDSSIIERVKTIRAKDIPSIIDLYITSDITLHEAVAMAEPN